MKKQCFHNVYSKIILLILSLMLTDTAPVTKPSCDVKPHHTLRERRYVIQNTIWHKSVVTWRIENFTTDLPKATVRKLIRKAFRKWAVWIPLTFKEQLWGKVDISIKFVVGKHKSCSVAFDGQEGNLAHAYYPYQGQDLAGDIHFDDAEVFVDNNIYSNNIIGGKDLAWTALHEIGHSLGLEHSKAWGAIMSPYYVSFYHPNNVLSLSTDDIKGIQTLYGSPLSHENSIENSYWFHWFK